MYPIPTSYGPTDEPACPNCRNSFQNGTPYGRPELRLCATCKTVFQYRSKRDIVLHVLKVSMRFSNELITSLESLSAETLIKLANEINIHVCEICYNQTFYAKSE